MKQFSVYDRASTTGLFFGLIGAVLLIVIHSLQGLVITYVLETLMLLSFFALVIFSVLKVKLYADENKYLKLFLTSLLTYILPVTIFMVYFVLLHPASFNSQLQNFFVINSFGVLICGAITFMVTRNR